MCYVCECMHECIHTDECEVVWIGVCMCALLDMCVSVLMCVSVHMCVSACMHEICI